MRGLFFGYHVASRQHQAVTPGQVDVRRIEEQEIEGKKKERVSYRTFVRVVVNICENLRLCSLGTISRQQLRDLGLSPSQCDLQWGHPLLILCIYVRAMR